MDNEQKYKNALERANMIYNDNKYKPEIAAFAKKLLETIFPEIAESEDERILRALTAVVKHYDTDESYWWKSCNVKQSQVLAWLEKQDDIIASYEDKLDRCACESFDKGYKAAIEKQGEQKIDICSNSNTMLNACINVLRNVGHLHLADWLEKQGRQNPTDKVVPKFKVKYAVGEYNVVDEKDIAGVTYYGIEDEPNHIDYVLPDDCEIISVYDIKENGSPYPTKPAVFSEQKPTDNVEPKESEDEIISDKNETRDIEQNLAGNDERIRKALLSGLKYLETELGWDTVGDVDILDAYAWLKKQETSYTSKDVVEAYTRGINDAKNEIEKQYEADYQIRKDIATFIFNYRGDIKDRAKWMDYLGIKAYFFEKQDEKPQGKSAIKMIKEEKVDNANKVEPKFKVGDWIIRSNKAFKHNAYLIKEVKDYYVCEDLKGRRVPFIFDDVHKNFKLWDIADAKDGDVIASELCDSIILYKGIEDNNIQFHCDYDFSEIDVPGDRFSINNNGQHGGNIEESKDFHPATKEQRNLLFQKMRDAGYKWNEETKEVKKIEAEFKVGDWVITKENENAKQIVRIEYFANGQPQYILSNGLWFGNGTEARLWTIEDAKDGDVLAFNNGTIVIFKDLYNASSFHSYCHIEDGIFNISRDDTPDWWNANGFYPATKEQCDIFFTEMKEWGYEWDAKKKELN